MRRGNRWPTGHSAAPAGLGRREIVGHEMVALPKTTLTVHAAVDKADRREVPVGRSVE
jgi:hypothetical protein